MATTFRAKAQRVCFKQHTCVACGSVYRYRFTRSVEAGASTQQAAQVEADKKLQTALDTTFDIRPCPVCGLVQPEMVGQARADQHGCMLGLAFLLIMVLGFLWNGDYFGYRTQMAIALFTCIFMTVKHIAAALHNPNNDLAANKVKAAADVKAGTTELIEAGNDPKIDYVPTDIPAQMKLAFMLLLISLVVLPFAELIRIPAGWGYNDHCVPPVAGPGDKVRYTPGESIESVKGYWNSAPVIMVKNAAELGVPPDSFSALPHTDYTTNVIQTTNYMKSATAKVYVDFTIPKLGQLARKKVDLDIRLNVKTPIYRFDNTFTEQAQTINLSKQFTVGPAGANDQYLFFWFAGMISGIVLQFVAGFMLNSRAEALKKGLGAQLIPIA